MSRFNSILSQSPAILATTAPSNVIVGTEYGDFLVGTNGKDKIVSREGADFVFGDGPLVYGTYLSGSICSNKPSHLLGFFSGPVRYFVG
jgi:hypothetical protein